LVNSAIFVIRYFGGTKLGIPGLSHAYGAAAEDAVEHATLKPWVQLCSLLLIYKYEVQKKVESVQKKYDANIIQQNFAGTVETIIEVRESICEEFIIQLEQKTNGTIQINKV
jgi:putative IMPACT (imprinted ancient) family translation regulator